MKEKNLTFEEELARESEILNEEATKLRSWKIKFKRRNHDNRVVYDCDVDEIEKHIDEIVKLFYSRIDHNTYMINDD